MKLRAIRRILADHDSGYISEACLGMVLGLYTLDYLESYPSGLW